MNTEKGIKEVYKKAPELVWAASSLLELIWLSEIKFNGINSTANSKTLKYRGYVIKLQ